MSRFHDESYYDRHWDLNQFEGEDECDCYWLANGDDDADVECGHCADRRREEEKDYEKRKSQICAIIRIYLDRHETLTGLDARADNFAQLFHYLTDQHEFLATQPIFREALRTKALEYLGCADVAFICGRMLDALERLPLWPGYVPSTREEAEIFATDDTDFLSDED